ncbi:hypothetical protein NC653_017717 [Populus alba x Populus x berolinensis]|uniref:Uncharacterized protein n=1 Tax=Populus alba x Populus x berolinensis TaxID=444605 RepID=A0AAD6W1C7_9ROSI|nr:hypothetical protein NC653_017717 [Populus alba x Populus x berolinensis]
MLAAVSLRKKFIPEVLPSEQTQDWDSYFRARIPSNPSSRQGLTSASRPDDYNLWWSSSCFLMMSTQTRFAFHLFANKG